MGTKATAKDMITLCNNFSEIIRHKGALARREGGSFQYPPEITKEFLEIIDKLTQFTYEEGRTEEIIKRIIERSKQDLINLIKEDEAFTRDEMEATQILQELKQHANKLKDFLKTDRRPGHNSIIEPIWQNIADLERLLVKDADIADAIQIVARDLEKLMQTLRKTEK